MFVDEAQIEIIAGRGGDGMVAFRREKYIPRGGPAGGDGGKGGDVIFVATNNVNTLSDFRHQKRVAADDGRHGGPNNMSGKQGADTIVYLPVGTLVHDKRSEEVIADLVEVGQTIVIARGGKGGLGNQNFATPTNRAPRRATPGKLGEKFQLRLELKLIADIGLIGFPSVGKSTIIAAISSARPKIADYPFTTLVPNLGVVQWKNFREFVVADIPGLIEGAHEGHGLGIQFLKHVERTNLLVHIIEVTPSIEGQDNPRDPIGDFEVIQKELARYNEALLEQPQLVILNKSDLPYVREQAEALRAHFQDELKLPFLIVSAATGENMDEFKNMLARAVSEGRFGAEDSREAWER
ncbi:MAG: GTPase ObgE [Bradymonadaceae bacterium]|nr:GTPase ObgE [Lujinxingiaceae bacterium]